MERAGTTQQAGAEQAGNAHTPVALPRLLVVLLLAAVAAGIVGAAASVQTGRDFRTASQEDVQRNLTAIEQVKQLVLAQRAQERAHEQRSEQVFQCLQRFGNALAAATRGQATPANPCPAAPKPLPTKPLPTIPPAPRQAKPMPWPQLLAGALCVVLALLAWRAWRRRRTG